MLHLPRYHKMKARLARIRRPAVSARALSFQVLLIVALFVMLAAALAVATGLTNMFLP